MEVNDGQAKSVYSFPTGMLTLIGAQALFAIGSATSGGCAGLCGPYAQGSKRLLPGRHLWTGTMNTTGARQQAFRATHGRRTMIGTSTWNFIRGCTAVNRR